MHVVISKRHLLLITKKKILLFFEACLLLIMLVCMRGMILGNLYPVFGMAIAFVLCLINIKKKYDHNVIVFAVCCIFWGYCVIQGMLLNSNSRGYLIQIFFYWFLEAGAAYLMFQKQREKNFFCKFIIRVLTFISGSYLISFSIGVLIGWSKIKLFELNYNYFYNAPLLFPFTFVYGSGKVAGIEIYRLLGIARESGIMQCLFSWAFFSAEKYIDRSQWTKVLLLLGLVSCLSTTGLVIFFGILAINQLTKNMKKLFSVQTLGVILVIAIAALLLLGEGTYGFKFRWENSFSERTVAMSYGLDNFQKHPLCGIGFFKTADSSVIHSEANFIASLGNIGLIGGILFLLIYVIAFICADDKRLFLTSNGDFFLTALIAQPLYVYPLMYVFLFSNIKTKQVHYKDNGNIAKSNKSMRSSLANN